MIFASPFRHGRLRFLAVPVLAGIALFAACDDPTTIVDDHLEAHGFVIAAGDVELLRWMEGDAAPVLTLEASNVYDVAITLLDEDGLPLEHGEHGAGEEEEETIRVTIGNTAIATWTPEDHHDEEHHVEVHGEIHALSAGSTQMEICLLHGDHCDWETNVTLTVQ